MAEPESGKFEHSESIERTEPQRQSELAAQGSVISGLDEQASHQSAKRLENKRSPSELELKTLRPGSPEYEQLMANRFEIVDDTSTGQEKPEQLAWSPEPAKPMPEAPPIGERISVDNLLGMDSPIGPACKKSATLR